VGRVSVIIVTEATTPDQVDSFSYNPLLAEVFKDYLSFVEHQVSMEDIDEYLSSRRNLIKTGATAAVAGLAGCSGDDGGSEDSTNTSTDTEQPSTEGGSDPTENDNSSNETSDGQQTEEQNSGVDSLLEEDESEAEADLEHRQWDADDSISAADAWIEMESPSEQIPEENYDFNEFPNLQVFEEIDLYSDENEAVYLFWADTDGKIALGAANVTNYKNEEGNVSDGSRAYTDQSADIERILDEVIEGVDDISENISDGYAEILRNS